ncbi:MAG: hypothetical protein LH477_12420 [Nocardioides sp.]|nr:hypothetical protein [Nocardioides sp.]
MSSSTPSRQTGKGRGHLLDLDAPRRVVIDPGAEERSLSKVQRWVMSTLAVITILHLSAGLIVAAIYLDEATRASQVGLNVIAGAFGVLAVLVGLGIHGRRLLSPWLLLGLAPTAVGLWLTLR